MTGRKREGRGTRRPIRGAAALSSPQITRKLRVLYYTAYPQRLAGANRSLHELITNLPPEIEGRVILSGEGSVADAYRESGLPVKVMPPGPSLSRYGKSAMRWSTAKRIQVLASEYVPYTLKLAREIVRHRVDIVHANDPRATILAGLAARLTRRPLVAHLRGDLAVHGLYRKVFLLLPHHIITVSRATKRVVDELRAGHSSAVYNGIGDVSNRGSPVPWLSALRKNGVVVIGYFASLCPFKAQHHLLEAVAELNRRGLRGRFAVVCVGDLVEEYREYQQWLFSLQSSLGIDNVLFAGWQADPFSFYRSVDFTVLASVAEERLTFNGRTIQVLGNEGFPRTHLEAMSFGLPIVGTAIAGVREQVEDGLNGFVVPPSDPMALADAMQRLINDPDLRAEMGSAGKKRVRELFSTEAYVSGVVDVYRRVTGPSGG